MYRQKIEELLKEAVLDLGFLASDIVVYTSENPKFGDYATNVPLQLSKQKLENSDQSPHEIANAIIEKIGHPAFLETIEVAGPGFINFHLKNEYLAKLLDTPLEAAEKDEYKTRYLVEYGHPNTHKEFHIGHLRTLSTGESLARLLEFQGHPVFRVDYGSDIGLPVAKALWGVLHKQPEYEAIKGDSSLKNKARFLGDCYAFAHAQYEDDPAVKEEIIQINTKIYQRQDPEIMELWQETKEWSLLYFQTLYSILGSEFDARINESEVDEVGKQIVLDNLGKIFIQDQGAIIFPGEKYGLHNRVFINSKGHPMYEAKELGLTRKEEELFPFDISLHVVDTQQTDFFKVVNKAVMLLNNLDQSKKRHVAYGFVSLTTGRMSSRMGNIISADDLIDEVTKAIEKDYQQTKLSADNYQKIAIAAVKFYYLKHSLLGDIVFDVQQSIALQGDTGPYVLYAFARIQSILNRANPVLASEQTSSVPDSEVENPKKVKIAQNQKLGELEPTERELLRQLEYFEGVIDQAVKSLEPNLIANYLLALTKSFNQFYEKSPIIGSKEEPFRLKLVTKVAEVIQLGMHLLGIAVVERM